jgi:hypothetical protein
MFGNHFDRCPVRQRTFGNLFDRCPVGQRMKENLFDRCSIGQRMKGNLFDRCSVGQRMKGNYFNRCMVGQRSYGNPFDWYPVKQIALKIPSIILIVILEYYNSSLCFSNIRNLIFEKVVFNTVRLIKKMSHSLFSNFRIVRKFVLS